LKRNKSLWFFVFFFGLVAFFLYPIFLGKVFVPADLLYQWLPWSLSGSKVLKEVLPPNNPLLGDAVTAFYPWYTFLGEAFSHGFFPLWNPLVMAGTPYLANWQSGALAVENFVFYFLKTPLALNINIFLKLFLSLSFTFLFLRKLKLSREAAAFGAIAYAFSAFFVVWLNWPQTRVAIWLPLILFCVENLLEKTNLRNSGFVSLSVAAAILAGHPGTLVQSFYIVFIYSIFRLFSEREELPKKAAFVLIGAGLGMGVASLLILPGVELMKNSFQFLGRSATDYWNAPSSLRSLVFFFSPRFYGHLKDGIYIGPLNFNEASAYVGLLPLFFSFWALTFVKKTKRMWPALALGGFSLMITYGVWPRFIFRWLPAISMQPMQRYTFILTFALAVLGAFGFEAFFAENKRKWRFLVLGVFFIAAFALVFYKVNPVIWDMYKNYFLFAFLPFLALFGVYFKPGKQALKWILIGLLVADLFLFGFKLNSYIEPKYLFTRNPVTDFIKKDTRLFRVLSPGYTSMLPNTLMPYDIYDLRGRDALIVNRFHQVSDVLASRKGYPNFIMPDKVDLPLLDFLNVKYVISDNLGKRDKLTPVYRYKGLRVYRNKNVLPRAYAVQKEVVANTKQALTYISSPQFDFKKQVVLNKKPVYSGRAKTYSGKSSVRITNYEPNEVRISVTLRDRSLVVMSDNNYPGWNAYVDGKKVSLYEANVSFRAVAVNKGKHRLEFIYQPDSFKYGLIISSLSLLTVIGFIGLGARH